MMWKKINGIRQTMSDKYYPADMVTQKYGMPPEAWDKLQKAYSDHLSSHPTCELCCRRPSGRITPLGPIRASCMECIQVQRQEMIDEHNRWLKEEQEEQENYRRQMNEEY